jgi:hypothetical protein
MQDQGSNPDISLIYLKGKIFSHQTTCQKYIWYFFFLKGKYIIIKNQVSAQDEETDKSGATKQKRRIM